MAAAPQARTSQTINAMGNAVLAGPLCVLSVGGKVDGGRGLFASLAEMTNLDSSVAGAGGTTIFR